MVAARDRHQLRIESDLRRIVQRYKDAGLDIESFTLSTVEVDNDCFALVRIPGASAKQQLSERQADIARLVGNGHGNKGIAEQLGISESTVSHHLSAIYRKWHIQSRAELARIAPILLSSSSSVDR